MKAQGKLMDMLCGYAAAHQHPFNILVHMIGIPAIMLGVLIPLTWLAVTIEGVSVTAAQVLLLGFVIFYATLDALFAAVFAIAASLLLLLATQIAAGSVATAWIVAAACFFGGYAAQFIGHAVEKSMPVLVKHPVQANLAAPFFTVVEICKLLGLREDLFDAVQEQVESRRPPQP